MSRLAAAAAVLVCTLIAAPALAAPPADTSSTGAGHHHAHKAKGHAKHVRHAHRKQLKGSGEGAGTKA